MSDFDDYDDLDAVRDFRTLDEPFPAALDAALRRRIVELAAERGLVAPAAPPPTDTGVVVAAGRASGPEPAAADGPLTAVVELRAPDRPRRSAVRLVAAVVVLVLALAAGVVARRESGTVGVEPGDEGRSGASVVTPPTGAGPGTSQAEGSQAVGLLTVAELVALVAAQPDRNLDGGGYQHLALQRTRRSDVRTPEGVTQPAVQTSTLERWATVDRSGEEIARHTANHEVEGGTGPRLGPPVSRRPLPAEIAFDGLSYRGLRNLPADRARLQAALAERRASMAASPAAEAVLAYLLMPVVRPAVRATLWQLLADRGLRPAVVEPARGGSAEEAGAGRPGLARFTFTDEAGEWTVAVDPRTGSLHSWERRTPDFPGVVAADVVLVAEVAPAITAGVLGP